MRLTAPGHSDAWSTATSGRRVTQARSASSQSPTSTTSWPACSSSRAIRRRLGFRACASSTRIGMRYPRTNPRRPNSRLGHERGDLADVGVHLLHERLDGLEAALAAGALEELQPQLAAVEIALEVQQEGLDQQPAP